MVSEEIRLNSQAQRVLEYLKEGNSITSMEALRKFGCFRLGARIYDLKQAGHLIQSEPVVVNGKRVAEYSLLSKKQLELF